MKQIATTEIARKSDAQTIESGVFSTLLMKNAGQAVVDYIKSQNLMDKKIVIVCGKGNNGGDGYCVASLLLDLGVLARVYCLDDKRSADAQFYADEFIQKGGTIEYFCDSFLCDAEVVVDAIFGTGLSKPITGEFATIIEKINESNAYVIACDIPSGINSDNGLVMGVAVEADATITFQSYKCGHFLNDGMDYCGKVVVADINISMLKSEIYLTEAEDLKKFFTPLKRNVHKGTFGKSAIIGGSKNYIGAPWFSAMGDFSLQVGSGLSYLVIPEVIYSALSERVVNNIVYTFPSPDGVIEFCDETLNKLLDMNSIAVGMGLGKCNCFNQILSYILEKSGAKVLIDADGLNLLDLDLLKKQNGRVLLTPHPKEFSRLCKKTVKEVLENPIELAKQFAKEYNVVLVLKGVASVITDGDRTFVNTRGVSGMAKGGSGDILDGITNGFLARGLSVFDAAVAGAYIAGRAAELSLEDELNDYSMLTAHRFGYITVAVNEIIKL